MDSGNALGASPPVQLFAITGTGFVRGSMTNPPPAVNLSTEGITDWAHWGLVTKSSLDRRAGAMPLISDVTTMGSGPVQRYTDNFTAFTWTNGSPAATVSGTRTGIFVAGVSNGFRITVPADTHPKRLKVYAGLYGARSRFEASLSDNSAAPFIDNSLTRNFANGYAVYTVDFAAGSSNQTLTVRYFAELLNDPDFGNVTWQAAALLPVPVPPSITARATGNSMMSGEFSTSPGASYTVEYTEVLAPVQWQPLTNILGTSSNATFSDAPPTPTRFYRVKLN